MKLLRFTPLAVLLFAADGAHAADKPIYAPAPAWVKSAPPINLAAVRDNAQVVLMLDAQQRLQDGEVHGYVDTAALISSSQALDANGTVKLPWQPDKGDLIIHRVEIIRGTEHIDLLAGGQRFQVLQREEQLEKRMLSGMLTATMAVEGLRLGDVLHITFSITRKDPVLGKEVMIVAPLLAEPFRAQFARMRILWPESSKVHWKTSAAGVIPEEHVVGGEHELIVTLPIAKRPEVPGDAPARFKLGALLEVSSFADWGAVAAVMAPLYKTDGLIAAGTPLAAEVAAIAKADTDPLRRSAAALKLVQGKIRYLFKGMDGGNYVPQTPTQTWSVRYGDCKAKTLLLLAILHDLGIEAEPVLASSQFGDGLTQRLPSPGAFDHVFVRATVAGEVLWLDGTASGTQLADIHDTPSLGYVLPLRASGAALLAIPQRPSARPDFAAVVDLDQTAGVNLPAPFKLSVSVRGQLAQVFKAVATQGDKDQLNDFAGKLAAPYLASPAIVTRALTFDEAKGTATMTATGISYPGWTREDQRYRATLDTTITGLSFEPDRTRAIWRDIPVATSAENLSALLRITLPDAGRGYELDGNATFSQPLAGHQIDRTAKMDGAVLTVDQSDRSSGAEIPAADIGALRQKLAQAVQHQLRVVAPADLPPNWQIIDNGKRAHAFNPLLALYAQAIVDQPGKAEPFTNRAWFYERIYDRRAAIADITSAIAIDPSAANYLWRAGFLEAVGERDKAIADVLEARKIDPGSTEAMTSLAGLYANKGDKAAALALLDERIDEGGKDKTSIMSTKADLLGKLGDRDAAMATIDMALLAKPSDAELLNERCWLKGTLELTLDTALKDCTKSIELSDSPSAALDSRAMVYFRMNRAEDALADINAALEISPNLASSLFLRGIIRKRAGDAKASATDFAAARMIAPRIDETFAKYGLKA